MSWPRTSRHERGYGYAWERLRNQVLERDRYLCQCAECKASGRLRTANEVDHVTPKAKGGTDDPSNLAAINGDCHKRKTMREQGRPLRARPKLGVDGYPAKAR